jgi:hypothetical protein
MTVHKLTHHEMIAEYLEHAITFERMASEADDPALREQLLRQASEYRNLAEDRADRLELSKLLLPRS